MKIEHYLNKLEGQSKRHVLLVVTPKDNYPTQFSDEEYYNLEKSILAKPKNYIDIYEEDEPEIMQYTAFRLFLKSKVCDCYRLNDKSTNKVKRMNKDEVTSFIVANHFYDTVPYGEKKEEEAISEGLIHFQEFIKKYPLDQFEFGSVALGKDSDEANVLIKLNFNNGSENYYFDYVYVH